MLKDEFPEQEARVLNQGFLATLRTLSSGPAFDPPYAERKRVFEALLDTRIREAPSYHDAVHLALIDFMVVLDQAGAGYFWGPRVSRATHPTAASVNGRIIWNILAEDVTSRRILPFEPRRP